MRFFAIWKHCIGPKNQRKEKKSEIRHVWILVYAKEIEYFDEKWYLFIYTNFFKKFMSFKKICTKYNLAYFLTFVKLLMKLTILKKLYNSTKLWCFVTIGRLLWKWLQECHLLWHGTFTKLLLITLAMLCLLVIWTSWGVIGH